MKKARQLLAVTDLFLLFGIDMITQEQIDDRLAQTPQERQSDTTLEEKRRNICATCSEKKEVAGFDQCSACGCLLIFKAKFKFSACPLNKWEIPSDN
jgi:hypothetical protein